MEDYLAFQATVEPIAWGKSTYTILRLPTSVPEVLIASGAKRVEGEIGDYPVNLALTRAPVIEGLFLWAGQSLLRDAGIQPGELLDVRLRKVDPDQVETPEDVTAALRAAGKTHAWTALTAGKRRGMLYQVVSAKRAETRTKRIAKLIDELT